MYNIPGKSSLIDEAGLSFENGSEEISAEFTLLQSLVSSYTIFYSLLNLFAPCSMNSSP